MSIKAKTKFPTKTQLHTVGIHNPHNIASLTPDKLFISWTPSSARGGYPAFFQIAHIGDSSDPKADYGHKMFRLLGGKEGREKGLAEAIVWANARYGVREWVKDPFGSYQDARAIALVWTAMASSPYPLGKDKV